MNKNTSYRNFNSSFSIFFFLRKLIKCFCKAKLQNLGEREREMSVFGGDSWGREAQHGKRRLDDLLLEELVDGSSYKKLSMANTPALFAPTLPSSILLSCSLYVPFFQFSALLIFIVLFLCVLSWVIFKVIRT